MRWKPTLLLMLIILQIVQPASSKEMASLYIEADRRVEVIGSGLITLNDIFTLRAPEGSRVVVERFEIGTLRGFEFERFSFSILVEGEWRTLEYEEGKGDPIVDARWISLKLPRPFTIEGEASLTIRAHYISYGWVTSSGNLHRALLPVYPLLPLNIASFNFSMILPRGASLVEVSSPIQITNSTEGGALILSHRGGSLAPLRNETAMVSYQPAPGDEQILDYELVRSIRISRWNLEVEDNYIINNRGPTINHIKLRIPRDSTNIEARDVAGPLTLSYRDDEGHRELQVFPRISIGEGMRMSLWVKYSLPSGGRVEGGWERYTLRYRVDTPPRYLRRATLRIILPEGGNLIGSSPEPDFIRPTSMLSQEAGFDLGGLIPGEGLEVVVEYDWPILYSALRVVQWLIIAACVIAPIYISKRRRVEERGREEKPRELESFRGIYLDRIALLAELEELQEKFERKEVGRETYDRRFGEITRRQGELLRDLRRLRSRLEGEPGLTKKLEAIDMDEEELRRVESDLRALEAHFRSRRISRGEFERRRKELVRRIRQARIRLERDVNAL